jgi:hypothetical protein
MFRTRFLRSAAVAFGIYGVLGLLIATTMLVVGSSTFGQVATLSTTLERERTALIESIRTASGTLRDTANATADFQRSIDTARGAADQASVLANDSAGTFRDLGASVKSLSFFGVQPLAGLGPQFDRSADQLQQLAVSLGTTREALGQNGSDVQRVGADLSLLQQQLDAVAASLNTPGVLGLDTRALVPFQIAFYGMCLLVILQSAFSIVAGMVLSRLAEALGDLPLFPHAQGRRALPAAPDAESDADVSGEPLSVVR